MGFCKDFRGVYQVADWKRLSWLDHGFGTAAAGFWRGGDGIATLKQIHSDAVVRVREQRGCLGQGDALVTSESEVFLMIRTADCVPVLLVDRLRRVVGAVHAGWRGTAAEIVLKTVRRMELEFGVRTADLEVAIGPSIGECCYEVGADVGSKFERWNPEFANGTEPVHLDLVDVNRRQLEEAGVREIAVLGMCTRCGGEEFESYRRDKEKSGRMVSGVAMIGE